MSGFELHHAHPTFQFTPDQYAEVMDYFAQVDGVIPSEGREEYNLSPWHDTKRNTSGLSRVRSPTMNVIG